MSGRIIPLLGFLWASLTCRTPAPGPQMIPEGRSRDGQDGQSVILGLTDRTAVLAHRQIFTDNLRQNPLPPTAATRWKQITAPCVLVVAFGSWCGDTQRELPDLLGLMATPNPFISVRMAGVSRDKRADPALWPEGIPPEPVEKVPTFWLYAMQPGGGYRLAGRIVENPPRKGQRMADAILEMLEALQ